jgi:hypothetical protein
MATHNEVSVIIPEQIKKKKKASLALQNDELSWFKCIGIFYLQGKQSLYNTLTTNYY